MVHRGEGDEAGGVNRAWGAAGAVLGVAAVGLALAGSPGGASQEDPFPHADHQGLFPVCSGCHAGVPDGAPDRHYPPPGQCVGCHDGVDEERVTWTGPSARASNVVFEHVDHASELEAAGDAALGCESCHSDLDTGRMSVDGAEELETCWSCHAHERSEHFEAAAADPCVSCHVPLAESGLDGPRLQALPAPDIHAGDDFLLFGHGPSAEAELGRCATCHVQDQCVDCHVDGSQPSIAGLPVAPPEFETPALPSSYPVPATHHVEGFEAAHPVADGAACSTCHTSDDCASCHLTPLPDAAARLPSRSEAMAPGVALESAAPATHGSFFFAETHATLAAAEPSTCVTCHTESYCVDCHDGPTDGGYHPPGFVSLHPSTAFGQAQECASCHNTAAFCRECHQEVGLGSTGRLGAGYHDAEPLFLLRHGQAARQSLESCASCHQQTDCVQCHGVLGAFQVSPHTEDFDARAAWARSPSTCLACHVSNPVGGGP